MIKWLKQLFKIYYVGDLSQHRQSTTKYEDLCM